MGRLEGGVGVPGRHRVLQRGVVLIRQGHLYQPQVKRLVIHTPGKALGGVRAVGVQ